MTTPKGGGFRGVQDTGNPVLDSLVNLASATGQRTPEVLKILHETLLKLAEKEPGGLKPAGAP